MNYFWVSQHTNTSASACTCMLVVLSWCALRCGCCSRCDLCGFCVLCVCFPLWLLMLMWNQCDGVHALRVSLNIRSGDKKYGNRNCVPEWVLDEGVVLESSMSLYTHNGTHTKKRLNKPLQEFHAQTSMILFPSLPFPMRCSYWWWQTLINILCGMLGNFIQYSGMGFINWTSWGKGDTPCEPERDSRSTWDK